MHGRHLQIIFAMVAAVAVLLTAEPLLAQSTPVLHVEDFESLAPGSMPSEWVETPVEQIRATSPLFSTLAEAGRRRNVVFGARRREETGGAIVHAARDGSRTGAFVTLVSRQFHAAGGFEYRGRFARNGYDSRIGFTFFSSYPEADQYYLISLTRQQLPSKKMTMQLLRFPEQSFGPASDSGFEPEPSRWYRFAIRAEETGGALAVRARFWPADAEEPQGWDMEVVDRGSRRLTSGRIGIWSGATGDVYVDDLEARSFGTDRGPAAVVFLEGGAPLDPAKIALFNRDVRLEIRASGGSITGTTLDGRPFDPAVPVTAEGSHLVQARATTEGGNRSAAELRFVIDRTAPVISIQVDGSPMVEGAVFNRPVAPAVKVADLSATAVEMSVDGRPYNQGAAITGEGTHTISVTAKDAAGHSSSLGPLTFQIDTVPPEITVEEPSGGPVSTSPQVELTGDAADAVRVFVNGQPATIDPTTRRYTALVTLDEGPNELKVTASDQAANLATKSVRLVLDTRQPDLSILYPPPGSCVDGGFIDLRGRVADSSTSRVTVRAGGATYDASVAADGNWRAQIPVEGEGPVDVTVEAKDAAGHPVSLERTIAVDRTPPVVEILESGQAFTAYLLNRPVAMTIRVTDADTSLALATLLDGQPYASGTPITDESREHTLHVTARDCAGHTVERELTFRIDTAPPRIVSILPPSGARITSLPQVRGTADADIVSLRIKESGVAATIQSGGVFSFPGLTFQNGENKLTLVASDAAGNRSETEYSVTLDADAPVVAVNVDGAPLSNGSLYRRAVTPVIAVSDPMAIVKATLNGAPFESGTPITADGSYTITAVATDRRGKESAPVSVTFSVRANAPTIRITAPIAGAAIRQETTDVTGVVSGNDVASVVVNGMAGTIRDGRFSVSGVPLQIGANTLTATATDRAGNTASDSVEAMRSEAPPLLSLVSPPARLVTSQRSLLVDGTTVSGASVSVNGTPVTVEADGHFRVAELPLVEGENSVIVAVRTPGGATNTVTSRVIADWTRPYAAITANGVEAADGSTFPAPPSVGVTASDPSGTAAALLVDGAQVSGTSVRLAPGTHTVTAVVRDGAGNETQLTRTFHVTGGEPAAATAEAPPARTGTCVIDQLQPASESVLEGDSVFLSGRSNAASVSVAGQTVPVIDGSFAVRLALVRGRNEVRISCADRGTEVVEGGVTVNLTRAGEPSVTIGSPEAGEDVTTPHVTVSGNVGDDVVSGDVNGIPFTPRGGGFSVPRVPLVEGLNVIVARARNAAGRTAIATVRLRYAGAEPLLAITSPISGVQTGASEIDVTGMYANVDPSTINVSNASLTTTAPQSETSGSFRATVTLNAAGRTRIHVTGQNRAGSGARAYVDVDNVAGAPWINITRPADNTIYPASASRPGAITGTISPVAGSTVTVNGVRATVEADFTFSATIEFSAGPVTHVTALVTTPDGATASDSVRLLHAQRPLSVVETTPKDGAAAADPAGRIVIAFSNPLDGPTVARALTLKDANGAQIAGEAFVDRDRVHFAPLRPLLGGGNYTVTVGTGLKDLTGSSLARPFSFSFRSAASAPLVPPQLDQKDIAGCPESAQITGRASAPGVSMRIDLDGATSTAVAGADGTFAFKVAFPREAGLHVVRVREMGGDGTLSPEAAVAYRIDCPPAAP